MITALLRNQGIACMCTDGLLFTSARASTAACTAAGYLSAKHLTVDACDGLSTGYSAWTASWGGKRKALTIIAYRGLAMRGVSYIQKNNQNNISG